MSSLKKISVAFVTALMLIQCFGVYPIFRTIRHNIQSEVKASIKAGIPEEDLVSFHFQAIQGEIRWTKPSKEFSYQGEMYDVIRWEVCEGDSVVYCFADVAESGLFARLNEMVNEQGYGNDEHPGVLANAIKVFFASFPMPKAIEWNTPKIQTSTCYGSTKVLPTASYCSGIDHPPQPPLLLIG
ncbi:MAG: hypothetical protein HWE14_00060 [Flavobacteriia bacterium]|nr:hypothetical protein [Flavobacteriia bacterium]